MSENKGSTAMTTKAGEKPIVCDMAQVKALLAGETVEVRSPLDPQPHVTSGGFVLCDDGVTWMDHPAWVTNPTGLDLNNEWECPFGKVGDLLWVKEEMLYTGDLAYIESVCFSYAADCGDVELTRRVRLLCKAEDLPQFWSRFNVEVLSVAVVQTDATWVWVATVRKEIPSTSPTPPAPSPAQGAAEWMYRVLRVVKNHIGCGKDSLILSDESAKAMRDDASAACAAYEAERSSAPSPAPVPGEGAERWIPVAERLPTHNYTVAIWVTGGHLHSGEDHLEVGSYIPEKNGWFVGAEDGDHPVVVSHWMHVDAPATGGAAGEAKGGGE